MYDVIIIGGGPAGLSAALILGRCRRRVLVCDSGRPRNRYAEHMHGYLSRDGTEPGELLRLGRDEIIRYGVEFNAREVTAASRAENHFRVMLDDGAVHTSRKLLLATGVSDVLPEIPGAKELYGRSVHHCPYCDGWEHKDERIAAVGKSAAAAIGLALNLRTWSAHITACTDGEEPTPAKRSLAARAGVEIRTEKITRLVSEAGRLVGIEMESGKGGAGRMAGECYPCDALFFNTDQVQRSPLAKQLGCRFKEDGAVVTNDKQCTMVPGLYLAGDADKDVQFVIVAAAEGATAAVAINKELQEEGRSDGRTERRSDEGAE